MKNMNLSEMHTLRREFRQIRKNKHKDTITKMGKRPRLHTKNFKSIWTGGGGFPGGAVVNNPPAKAGDMGLSPGPGRSHMLRCN